MFGPKPTRVDESTKELLDGSIEWANKNLEFAQIRPYVDTRGIKTGEAFLKQVHKRPGKWSKGVPTFSFGMIYDNDLVKYNMGIRPPEGGSIGIDHTLSSISTFYPESETSRIRANEAFINIEPDDYVVGGRVLMAEHCCYPTADLKLKIDPIEVDTHSNYITDLVGDHSSDRAMLSVTYVPISKAWFNTGLSTWGIGNGSVMAEHRKQGQYIETLGGGELHQDQGRHMASANISDQLGQRAFRADIHVFAASKDESSVNERYDEMIDMFAELDNSSNGQEMIVQKITGTELFDDMSNVIRREMPNQGWLNRQMFGPNNVYTARQLADAFVHLPTQDAPNEQFTVKTPYIDYSEMVSGEGVPAGAPTPDSEVVDGD